MTRPPSGGSLSPPRKMPQTPTGAGPLLTFHQPSSLTSQRWDPVAKTLKGNNLAVSFDDQIRSRAYLIWEAEGRPNGCSLAHWDQATKELAMLAFAAAAPAKSKGKSVRAAPANFSARASSGKQRRATPRSAH